MQIISQSYLWSCWFFPAMGSGRFDSSHNRKFHQVFIGISSPQSLLPMQIRLLSRSRCVGIRYLVRERSSVGVINIRLMGCFIGALDNMANMVLFSQPVPTWHCTLLDHIQYQYVHLQLPFPKSPLLLTITHYNLVGISVPIEWNLGTVIS